MIGGSEVPYLLSGEKLLWVVRGVKVSDAEGVELETDKGDLYVTNMRLIFHGKLGSFSKLLRKGKKGVATLSLFFRNMEEIKAVGVISKGLEVKYPKSSRFSLLKSDRVVLKGLTDEQIGRIVSIVEEFKESSKPIPVAELAGEGGETGKEGLISKILKVINPDEGGEGAVSFGIADIFKRKKEVEAKRREEELLKVPPDVEVEGEMELICPACGEYVLWRPGMYVCPACGRKVNFFSGKVLD
ncbi:MAG: hypothetical protein ACTSWP_00815 [Candidatus Freyarchaeota archaeon]|nr:hypothetical protein [Candidatus Freyrarchaeum guaymaensis]